MSFSVAVNHKTNLLGYGWLRSFRNDSARPGADEWLDLFAMSGCQGSPGTGGKG